MHRNSRLKKSKEMQQHADIYLLLNYSTCFGRASRPSSGVHKSVFAAYCTDHTIWGASFFKRDQIRSGHVWRSSLPRQYDLYQRLQIQLYVLLMMGAMGARNMWNNLAVNKYQHIVASCWIISTFVSSGCMWEVILVVMGMNTSVMWLRRCELCLLVAMGGDVDCRKYSSVAHYLSIPRSCDFFNGGESVDGYYVKSCTRREFISDFL